MTDPERDAFDIRPTGDEMLARVRSEGAGGRGRLRIYLGMAPGVGKTFRMLEEGHRRRDRGTDVVVGFAEAHGRPHTLELLQRDCSHLERALREAGLDLAGGGLNFSLRGQDREAGDAPHGRARWCVRARSATSARTSFTPTSQISSPRFRASATKRRS